MKPHPAAPSTLASSGARVVRRLGDLVTMSGLALPLLGADDETSHRVEDAPDKSAYHLFHPTPAGEMRELSTDRPDQTESAYTVDAGHIQLEMDFVNAHFDQDRSQGGDLRTRGWGIAPFNLKVGLLNRVDLQFLVDTQVHLRIEDRTTGQVMRGTGLGDFQTRLKVNLWGNDGGRTALAVMPYVKWPLKASSLRNGQTEGGLIFPLAIELPRGWSVGLMTEFDFIATNDNRYDTEFVNLVTLGHEVIGPLSAYLEFASVVSTMANIDWSGQVDLGFTYAVNRNTQLDFGCNFGVTANAPDFNPFVGLSWRF